MKRRVNKVINKNRSVTQFVSMLYKYALALNFVDK